MKIILAIVTVTILSTASILAYGQSFYQNSDLAVIEKIEQLRNELEVIYRDRNEQSLNRDDVLRIERALHYLKSSRKLVEYNWHKRAMSEVNNGIQLVNLYNQNKEAS